MSEIIHLHLTTTHILNNADHIRKRHGMLLQLCSKVFIYLTVSCKTNQTIYIDAVMQCYVTSIAQAA